jgi:hypothetical protein
MAVGNEGKARYQAGPLTSAHRTSYVLNNSYMFRREVRSTGSLKYRGVPAPLHVHDKCSAKYEGI